MLDHLINFDPEVLPTSEAPPPVAKATPAAAVTSDDCEHGSFSDKSYAWLVRWTGDETPGKPRPAGCHAKTA